MRVRIAQKAGYANPRRDLDLQFGETVELPDDLGAKLIRLGIAEAVPAKKAVAAPKLETAEAAPPETTAARTSKPKPRTSKR